MIAKVTKTRQNTKLQMKVDDLLRLALLAEHGGLMVRLSEGLVIEGLHWIEEEFGFDEDNTEVLLFAERNEK